MIVDMKEPDRHYKVIDSHSSLPLEGKVVLRKLKKEVALPKFIVECRAKDGMVLSKEGIEDENEAKERFVQMVKCYESIS